LNFVEQPLPALDKAFLVAVSLAALGWRGCRSKRNQDKRRAQALKCHNDQK
jgi:hypothetical protein